LNATQKTCLAKCMDRYLDAYSTVFRAVYTIHLQTSGQGPLPEEKK